MAKKSYFYQDLTWPELKERIKDQPVILLPVGSVEDHGRHLPLKTDNFLSNSVCVETAKRLPRDVLVMPQISYGFNLHHSADFPGTIHVDGSHFINYVLDVTKSIAYHGFRKILIVDGHGSNMPFLEIVARRTVLETNSICAALIYTVLAREVVTELRKSEKPGGMAHAGEFETALYLYLDKDSVQMRNAEKEIGFPKSNFFWLDLEEDGPVKLMEWWSTFSKTGVVGDPTVATEEEGRKLFNTIIQQMVKLVQEFRKREIRVRKDMH